MTSCLRGLSPVKDMSKAFAKDHFHREPEVHFGQSCNNGGRGSHARYHFGMLKQDNKAERNGHECSKEDVAEKDSADQLYRESKRHFATWEIKDIVQNDGIVDNGGGGAKGLSSVRRQKHDEDLRLTNEKFKCEPMGVLKLDKSQDRLDYRDEECAGSLLREDCQRGESVERELNGFHRSKRKESSFRKDVESQGHERSSNVGRSHNKNEEQQQQQPPVDERDILLKEIESLAVDSSQSPDRRIQAMIERLKSREESKLRSRRERRSGSPEKEARGRTRSSGCDRREPRPLIDYVLDNRSNERGKRTKDDREDERRLTESKLLHGRLDYEENVGRRYRLVDRRSKSAERIQQSELLFPDKEPRRDEQFRQRSDTYNAERIYRRRSKEDEDENQLRQKDSSKRRSHTYEDSPDNFDARIQRYDRALLEPKRDFGSPRRSSPKDPSLIRKESLKENNREPVSKKNSFRADSKRSTNKDCESNLTRKTSFKDQHNDGYKRHVLKSPLETSIRSTYFGKDQEDRKDSFKDMNVETDKNGYLKTQDGAFKRTYLKDSSHDVERKVSSKEHSSSVSKTVLRNFNDKSGRSNSFKNSSEDSGKRNSFKEKNIEFGGFPYKNRTSDLEKKNSFKKDENESPERVLYHDYENNIDRKTANERYIEFGKVSFKTTQDDEPRASPFKENNGMPVIQTDSFKERSSTKRRMSLRNKAREASDRKSDRYSKPLTSPDRKDESLEVCEDSDKDPKSFSVKSWHENNRMFSAKYLREHSKVRGAPEERLDVADVSPERGLPILLDVNTAIETTAIAHNSEEQEDRFGMSDRIDPTRDDEPRLSTSKCNGTTIIRIRSSEHQPIEKSRRRRRVAQEMCAERRGKTYEDQDNEDSAVSVDEAAAKEEKDRRRWSRREVLLGRNAAGGGNTDDATPSRTMWNYREGVWHFHESIAFDRSFTVQRREAIFINRWRK